MQNFWKRSETVVMHIVATGVIIFALLIAVGIVKAEPRCHQHHGVTHCH